MDWKVFAATFSAIFLAEMGDKTQLAAMSLSAQTQKPWAVFLGAALALTAVSALGVAVGGLLGAHLPVAWVKRIAGALFVGVGVLMLAGRI
jgi:putative Ca2+/H+ antiporter (TMEM165/GDT1 family)